MTRYWIGVGCEEHVNAARKLGIAQFCHGKLWPARKLSEGDWIIYYSPKTQMRGNVPCKSFTALGQVIDSKAYQVEQLPGFSPHRRQVQYLNSQKVAMEEVKKTLLFVHKSPNWGMLIRQGFFEIESEDFHTIKKLMLSSQQ